ncbi:hypothetical protein GCM10027028_30690 [Streptomyces sundarbansensis]
MRIALRCEWPEREIDRSAREWDLAPGTPGPCPGGVFRVPARAGGSRRGARPPKW